MRHLRMAVVGVWSLVCVWSAAWAWQVTLNGTADRAELATGVTVDAAGDAVAAGWTENRGSGLDVTVAKVAGASGAEVWRMALDGAAHRDDQAFAVSVDGVGDVLTAGVTSQSDTGGDFTVVKVAGANGAEVWRASLDGTGAGTDQANAVTVDGKGDVLAAGWTSPTSPRLLPRMEASFTVVKRRGTDGGDF
jgi:hypothetical protein